MGQFFERFVTGKIFISKMKLILMSLLVLGPCYGMDAMFKKIMKQTAKHTFDAACFGENNKNNYDLAVGAAIEKCLQLAPATSLFPSVNTKNPFRRVRGRWAWSHGSRQRSLRGGEVCVRFLLGSSRDVNLYRFRLIKSKNIFIPFSVDLIVLFLCLQHESLYCKL